MKPLKLAASGAFVFRHLKAELLKIEAVGRIARKIRPPRAKKSKSRDHFALGNHFALEQARRSAKVTAHARQKAERSVVEHELTVERFVPRFEDLSDRFVTPPESVAFFTVCNPLYFRGLEALLLSLVRTYPALRARFIVGHDGSLSWFARKRLLEIYPHCEFVVDKMEWFKNELDDTHNHRRVGRLGFLNTLALDLRGLSHVVLLDADVLILGDISELWQVDDKISAGYCFGDREYCAVSEKTGRGVINSGVISIPSLFLNDASKAEMRQILTDIHDPACPLLDRFADQKAWNLFLADKPLRMLPYNYNCNIKQVAQFHQGTLEGIRILHFMGPKPWLTKDFVEDAEAKIPQLQSLTYHTPWRSEYRSLLYEKRLSLYRKELERTRRVPVRQAVSPLPETCLIIGNGPSIANTDLLKLPNVEKVCFNWFVLHEHFDQIAPDHLVLASHIFFGGWNCLSPEFPQNFLQVLRKNKHKPVIWAPFYFKPLIERIGLMDEFECQFFLFEKPFKKFVDRHGYGRTSLDGFLMDGRTAALSVAVPIACHLGFRKIVLVGCDSSYQQDETSSSDYFYHEAVHTSERVPNDLLEDLWRPDGPGQFSYSLLARQLVEDGRQLLDATVGGQLKNVAKLQYDDLVREVVSGQNAR